MSYSVAEFIEDIRRTSLFTEPIAMADTPTPTPTPAPIPKKVTPRNPDVQNPRPRKVGLPPKAKMPKKPGS